MVVELPDVNNLLFQGVGSVAFRSLVASLWEVLDELHLWQGKADTAVPQLAQVIG